MKKTRMITAALAICTFLLAACSPEAPAAPVEAAVSPQPTGVIAAGRLMPSTYQEQSFTIPGQVAEVLVEDGDEVQAGQVLAVLADSPDARLALARAQQEVLQAELALKQLEASAGVNLSQQRLAAIAAEEKLDEAQQQYDLNESDAHQAELDAARAALELAQDTVDSLDAGDGVDPDQRAEAEARLATARASLAASQAAVDSLELRASMDGTVVDMALQPGQRVTPGVVTATLADFSTWVVKTDNLTESDVVDVEVGQKANIILDALPEMTISGEVSHINTRYEEKRGDITYTVTVTVPQTDPYMRWGMTAAVQFLP